ncbi:MAG: DMT family transporter [Pseudomonadota bacterium]
MDRRRPGPLISLSGADLSPLGAALLLGLFSAMTLAAANVSVKMGGDILASRALLQLSASILTLPLIFILPWPDAATFSALMIAVPVHFAYQLALIAAFKHGDLSLVFPIMRGTAPLLTAGAAWVVLDEALPLAALAGLLIATLAVIVFALPPRGRRMRAHPDARAIAFAALTAIGIALYNVADARGVRLAPSPATFIVWLFTFDCVGTGTLFLVRRRGQIRDSIRRHWRFGLLGGVLSIFSYGAALYAFTLTEAARVSAIRETAVVFAAIAGAVLLKEGFGPRRIAAAAALAAGLILMQLAN